MEKQKFIDAILALVLEYKAEADSTSHNERPNKPIANCTTCENYASCFNDPGIVGMSTTPCEDYIHAKNPSKTELIKSLGWVNEGYNDFGRQIFTLGHSALFEHQNRIGIVKDGSEFIYCDLTDREIAKYNELVKIVDKMERNPEKFTLQEWNTANIDLDAFETELEARTLLNEDIGLEEIL